MTATYPQATDQINDHFWSRFNTSSVSTICEGYIPDIRWQYTIEPAKPDSSKIWGRFSIQTVTEKQKALSSEVGESGKRRYTAYGLVFLQLFLPKSNAKSGQIGRKLGEFVKNSFRGKTTSGHILFRNARVNELPPEDQFYRLNVVAEFEYDDIG